MLNRGTPSFRGYANSFQTQGNGAVAAQTILSIGSLANGPDVIVRSCKVWHQSAAALAGAPLMARLSRDDGTMATGGTLLVKRGYHPLNVSDALVEVRGGASGHGVLTPVVATADAGSLVECHVGRLHTAVGAAFDPGNELILFPETGVVVSAGTSLLVEAEDVAGTLPATDFFLVSIYWEEI